MVTITATIIFSLSPETPLIERAWKKIIEAERLNEQIQSLILIEPGFGLSVDTVEDGEIYPCGDVAEWE
jgi:hypothetical protein